MAAAPDILFLKDTNGDGIADLREIVLTGFVLGVSDSLVSGLRFGPDNRIHGANGGNGGGYLACLDFKTGEVLWNERDSDKRRVTKGSVAFADGRIYYRTEEGPVVLIEPSRKEYLERGRFTQPERTDKPAWAHPVIANGRLYIRDQGTLFCYDVKAK